MRDLAHALSLDAEDSLARFRALFHHPVGQTYMDGNSLGLLSTTAEKTLLQAIHEWKTRGIGGWLEGESPWFDMAECLAARIAPLVGASADEVAVGNSVTVNLHQLLATLYRPDNSRRKILMEAPSFPSDRYAIQSHLRSHGLTLKDNLLLFPADQDGLLQEAKIIEGLDNSDVQMAILPSVVFTTGQLLNLREISGAARERGVLIGWDLSHSIGVLPHQLDELGVDCAFWCHYKYVNAGPGSVGGLYLNRRHWDQEGKVTPGLAGWWGGDKKTMFEMGPSLKPAQGAAGLQIGTPHVLSMAPLDGALEVMEQAGIEAIRGKSLSLTGYLMDLVDQELRPNEGRVVTPREESRRGGHVAIQHPEAAAICVALRKRGVIPDFRQPDLIRLAPSPLYTSFHDCFVAVRELKAVIDDQSYQGYRSARPLVT